jgi:hypothetical protein
MNNNEKFDMDIRSKAKAFEANYSQNDLENISKLLDDRMPLSNKIPLEQVNKHKPSVFSVLMAKLGFTLIFVGISTVGLVESDVLTDNQDLGQIFPNEKEYNSKTIATASFATNQDIELENKRSNVFSIKSLSLMPFSNESVNVKLQILPPPLEFRELVETADKNVYLNPTPVLASLTPAHYSNGFAFSSSRTRIAGLDNLQANNLAKVAQDLTTDIFFGHTINTQKLTGSGQINQYLGLRVTNEISHFFSISSGISYKKINVQQFQLSEFKDSAQDDFGKVTEQRLITPKSFHYCELPLLFQYNMKGHQEIYLGAALSYLVNTSFEVENIDQTSSNNVVSRNTQWGNGGRFNDTNIGMMVGVTRNISDYLQIRAEYYKALNDFTSEDFYQNRLNYSESSLRISLNYRLSN